jgi:hypothetical protein
MLWKRYPRQSETTITYRDAVDIVSKVGEIYADLSDQRQLVKSQASLPCPWFVARECFLFAFEREYIDLSDNLKNSFHHVYRELSFFVDDTLFREFNVALDVAVKCKSESFKAMGLPIDEAKCRWLIASQAVIGKDRNEIWSDLASEETCPREHIVVLAETLSYCSALYRVMWDEFVAFENLIAHRKKLGSPPKA